MSVDLRKRFEKDEKLHILNKRLAEYKNPLIIDYDDSDTYYELPVSHFKVGNKSVKLSKINLMVDSGTTFTHFPDSYINGIMDALNKWCNANSNKCGLIKNPNFNTDSCLEYK